MTALRLGVLVLAPEAPEDALVAATLASLVWQHHRAWVARGPAVRMTDPRWAATRPGGLDDGLQALLDDGADAVCVLGTGDVLHPDALSRLAAGLVSASWAYADEQAGSGGEAVCRPAWSPALLRSTPYTGRPVLVRAELLSGLLAEGPLDTTAPEWDLALRAGRRAVPVHLPRVLVVRAAPEPPFGLAAAARVLSADARRHGEQVLVEATPAPGVFVTRPGRTAPPPPVTVVVPTAGSSRTVWGEERVLVLHCLERLLAVTDHPDLRVVVVVDEKTPDDVRLRLAQQPPQVTCLERSGPFNFSEIVNVGVAAATTDLVLLLNDDTEVVHADWLSRMCEVVEQPGVGAVGAKLLFEDGRLQHVGLEHNALGLPVHVHWGDPPTTDHRGSTTATLERVAVTGACLLTRRSLFAQIGGFSPDFPVNYNDVDYCLRLATAGHRVVQCNAVTLHHFESSSRPGGVAPEDEQHYLRVWAERSCRDPWAFVFRWAGVAQGALGDDDVKRLVAARRSGRTGHVT